MTELHSKIPADCPVDVKNVKTLDTSDGYAMTATLFFDGKRVAVVENQGTGGGSFYHPLGYGGPEADRTEFDANRAALDRARAYANDWAGDEYSENLDLLIEELVSEKDLAREAKKMRKRGAPYVVAGFTHPYKVSGGDDETHYGGSVVAGGGSLDDALSNARGAGAVAYRVL